METYAVSHLAKLNFKNVVKATARDPVVAKRNKLVAGLEEQKLVFDAAVRGEHHFIERSKWQTDDQGQRVLVKTRRRARAWFFEQDGGWYVQARYGARVIAADRKNNAVFVKTLKEVGSVLDLFIAAARAGEMDAAITAAVTRTRTAAQAEGDDRG